MRTFEQESVGAASLGGPGGAEAAAGRRGARQLSRVVFALTLALVAGPAVPYGSAEPWWRLFFDAGCFAVAALAAAEWFRDGGRRLPPLRLLLPAVALLIYSLVQTVPLGAPEGPHWHAVSADPYETRLFSLHLAALIIVGALLLRYTDGRGRLHALVLTVVGVCAASALFGLLRQASQHSDEGFVLASLRRGIGYGQIISRNQFCFMMEMGLGLALGMCGRRNRVWLIYLSLALLMAAALILANSRGGIMTMLCQLLLFALLPRPASRHLRARARVLGSLAARAALASALLAFAVIVVVWVGGESVVSNLGTVAGEVNGPPADYVGPRANVRRVEMWKDTLRLFEEYPLTGVGFGGYWIAITEFHDASGGYTPQQAHNDYLELLASGGLVGAVLAGWLAIMFAPRVRVALRSDDWLRRGACEGALIGLFGVAVHSIFDFGLHLPANAFLFVALLAVAATDVGRAGALSAEPGVA